MKAGIFWVLIFLTVIGLSKSQEEPQNSEEIVSNEEASDAALLRNFFTVNLSSRNGNRRKGQNNNPRNFVESKRGTQQKRLGQLFQALSDPIGYAKFMRQQVRRRNQQKRRLANSPPQNANLPPKTKNNRRPPPPRPNKRIASSQEPPKKPQKSRLEPYKKKIVPQEQRHKYLPKGGKEAGGKRLRGKEVNRSHNKRPLPPTRSKLPPRGKEVPKRIGGKLPLREVNPYLRQKLEAKRPQREPPMGQRAKAPSREVKPEPQPPRREAKEPPQKSNFRGKSEEEIDEFTAPQAPRPRKRKPILAVRRRVKPSKNRPRNVQKESKSSESEKQQLRKNPASQAPPRLRQARPTTTISTTSTSTTSSASRIPVVKSQNSVVRNSNENVGGFTKEGPNFAFPDMDMDDLIKMGDIEKFFNENFFQKTGSRSSNEVFKQDAFNGVPESHYEPTTFKSPGFNNVGRTGQQVQPKTTTEFSLGGLSGIGRFPPQETTSKSETDMLRKRLLNFRADGSSETSGKDQSSGVKPGTSSSETEDPFSIWAKQMMPSENSFNTYDNHHHNEKRFTDVLRRSFSQPRGRERRPSPPQPPPLPSRMKSPDRRPYAWLEDDFGTNFGRKQESLQPRIDRTPAIRNPLLQPFRNVPEKQQVLNPRNRVQLQKQQEINRARSRTESSLPFLDTKFDQDDYSRYHPPSRPIHMENARYQLVNDNPRPPFSNNLERSTVKSTTTTDSSTTEEPEYEYYYEYIYEEDLPEFKDKLPPNIILETTTPTKQTVLATTSKFDPPLTASNVPFLNGDYEYYYDDEVEQTSQMNKVEQTTTTPRPRWSVIDKEVTTEPRWPSINRVVTTRAPRWPIGRESFTEADAKATTTWKPVTVGYAKESYQTSSEVFKPMDFKVREPIRYRETTRAPNVPTTTTTQPPTVGYRFKRPEEVVFDENAPCELVNLCDVSEKKYPLKTVESIVVSEGPAVLGLYQQVIREYPELIGGLSSMWESKRRRIGSCDTKEELTKPGWAETVDGEWVTVINTHEYPQEVKTTQCRNLGTSCSLTYTSSKTSCQQKFTDRRLMAVDPKEPERGIFTAVFSIPSSCACSANSNSTRGNELTTSTSTNSPFLGRESIRRRDPPVDRNPTRIKQITSKPRFKIQDEFNKDWLLNFEYGRQRTERTTTKSTTTTTTTTTRRTTTRPTTTTTTTTEEIPFLMSREDTDADDLYYYDYQYYYETERTEPLETTTFEYTSTTPTTTTTTTTTTSTTTTTTTTTRRTTTVTTEDVPILPTLGFNGFKNEFMPELGLTTLFDLDPMDDRKSSSTFKSTETEDQDESTTTLQRPRYSSTPRNVEEPKKNFNLLKPKLKSVPKVGKPIKPGKMKKISRTKLSTYAPKVTTNNPNSPDELDDSVYNIRRERVKPEILQELIRKEAVTAMTTSTTATPLSPHRRASIHRMRDRYKSQLLAQNKDDDKDDDEKVSTTTLRTNMSTRRRIPPRPKKEEKEEAKDESKKSEKIPAISGGATDFYSKFRKRHRLGGKTEETKLDTTPRAQERSDMPSEIMDIAPSFESSSFDFNMPKPSGKKTVEDYNDYSDDDDDYIPTAPSAKEPFSTESSPAFSPTRLSIDAPRRFSFTSSRTKKPEPKPDEVEEKSDTPRRFSFTSSRTTPEPKPEPVVVKEKSEADKISEMLKNGDIKDPRKIKEMMLKLKEIKAKGPEKSGVEKPATKTWTPTRQTYSHTKEDEEEYDDDYDYDDDYEDDEGSELSPMGIDTQVGRKRMQSSSSLFRKFASDNVGNGFRRPKPKDNDANRANEIFDKYSRTSVTESPSSQEDNETSTTKKSSFSDMYRKKYGSRRTTSSENTSVEKVTYPPRPEKVTYPPRPTTTLKYSRFVPTARANLPKFPRVRTTTLSTTTATTTTTTTTTTTRKHVISNYPEPSLDTSLFGDFEPERSYNDLEKVPSTNAMNIDTSSFELDSMNFEDGESAMAQTDRSSQLSSKIVSQPLNKSKMSPVPIRKVLDIFQELRLSFGRNQ